MTQPLSTRGVGLRRWAGGLPLLLLAACAGGLRDSGPSIGDLQRQRGDEAEALVIDRTPPVAASPELALENYRRLLELAPDAETRAEALRRMADLQLTLDDHDPGAQSLQRIDTAIELYRRLLRERPDDPGNDRVLYQLARAHQARGEHAAAIDTLAALIARYPESSYAADGRFRRAELLYAAQRYAEALPDYAAVLAQRQRSAFFDAAEYKYAWTLYQLSRHAQVIEVTHTLLTRELAGVDTPPVDAATDVDLMQWQAAVLAALPAGRRDLVRDVLRLNGLAFAAQGGPEALRAWQQAGSAKDLPALLPLYHLGLAALMLDRDGPAAAAASLAGFADQQPWHPLAPAFREQAIARLRETGDADAVLAGLRRYAADYAPDGAYWQHSSLAQPDWQAGHGVPAQLREALDTLARHHHARAQQSASTSAVADYRQAAADYGKLIPLLADAPAIAEASLLRAEALQGAGDWLAAAEAYAVVAYELPAHAASADAAYAELLARHRLADEDGQPSTRRAAVAAALRYADAFPGHGERAAVLTRSSEDLYALGDLEQAIEIADRLLVEPSLASPAQRHAVRGIRADAAFALQRYAAAEADYLALLDEPDEDADRLRDQAALSMLRQGEAAEAAGDTGVAVEHWLRIGQRLPDAPLRAEVEHRAAVLLFDTEDWPAAQRLLEDFRVQHPGHALVADVDKRLATVYLRSGQPTAAAAAYARIAERDDETPEVRREAAWQAVSLYDEVGDAAVAERYAAFLAAYAAPSPEATRARQRLVELHRDGDASRYRYWLREAVAHGDAGDDAARLLAARASLELARIAVADSQRIALRQPLQRSLRQRRDAMQQAVDALARADAYGYAEISTAAQAARGRLYQQLAHDLIHSEPPRGLDELALEEYQMLLEEQAFPFEEQAIELHELNLRRIEQGLYDEAIRDSHHALLELVPGRYEKSPLLEPLHDALR